MSKEDKVIDQSRGGPSFRRINPGEGAKYIEGMIAHCLSYHPEIVSWLRGSIDPDIQVLIISYSVYAFIININEIYIFKSRLLILISTIGDIFICVYLAYCKGHKYIYIFTMSKEDKAMTYIIVVYISVVGDIYLFVA